MTKSRILSGLVCTSDPLQRELLESLLVSRVGALRSATSAAEAVELAAEMQADLIFTESFGEVADYLDALFQWRSEAVVVLLNLRMPPPGERNRIFAAVPPGAGTEECRSIVDRAIDFFRELRETRELERIDRARFQNRLEWLLWKRTHEARRLVDYGLRLVGNLRHSIAQGEGVGTLLAQAEFLDMMPLDADGRRLIPLSLSESIARSARAVRAWLDSLQRFSAAGARHYVARAMDGAALGNCMRDAIAAVERFRQVGGQRLHCESFDKSVLAAADGDALGLVLREILTNSFKYSPPGSTVEVALFRAGAWITIAVINDLDGRPRPENWTEEAFVPFVRFSNVYSDDFLDEELGLGIGLPVIQEALRQMGGALFLRTLKDHTRSPQPVERVIAEVALKSVSSLVAAGAEASAIPPAHHNATAAERKH